LSWTIRVMRGPVEGCSVRCLVGGWCGLGLLVGAAISCCCCCCCCCSCCACCCCCSGCWGVGLGDDEDGAGASTISASPPFAAGAGGGGPGDAVVGSTSILPCRCAARCCARNCGVARRGSATAGAVVFLLVMTRRCHCRRQHILLSAQRTTTPARDLNGE